MNYYPLIADNFQSTIETIAMSVDGLAEGIEQASQLMVECLLRDRKIIACGNGVDGALAQVLVSTLLSRFDQERPALPAMLLAADGPSLTAITRSSGSNDIYSRPLRALGQEGDVLLCISSAAGASNLVRAVQAAHERNMAVIALSNTGDGELGALLKSEDVELRVEAPRSARVVELQLMTIHCFCELIDQSLFGSYNQE